MPASEAFNAESLISSEDGDPVDFLMADATMISARITYEAAVRKDIESWIVSVEGSRA